MPTDEEIKAGIETNSKRYGNDKTPDDVFDDRLRPRPFKLKEALAVTEHLNEKEATAFVEEHLVTSPAKVEMGGKSELFRNEARFDAFAFQGRHMVAQAIWIYELIDAYRHPDFPEKCRECGTSLGGTWVGHPDNGEPGVLCRDCADIGPDDHL